MALQPKRTVSSALEVLAEALSIRQRQSLDLPAPELPKPTSEHKTSPFPPTFTAGAPAMTTEEILAKRQANLGGNMALFFPDEPLHIIKGRGCELFDAEGASYLDCKYNYPSFLWPGSCLYELDHLYHVRKNSPLHNFLSYYN